MSENKSSYGNEENENNKITSLLLDLELAQEIIKKLRDDFDIYHNRLSAIVQQRCTCDDPNDDSTANVGICQWCSFLKYVEKGE